VGTYTYTLVNNTVNNSFGVEGSTTACLGSGATTITYNIDPNIIKNNYPGTLYNVSWGDGTPAISYTYCQIVAANGKVSHQYVKASCGNVVKGQNNSFEVKLQLTSPFCGNVGTPVASYAKVISPPVNAPLIPVAGCLNSEVRFTNNSFPGDDPNSTSANCSNTKARYTWLVDGATKAINLKLSDPFLFTFTTKGVHKVTLQLQNNTGACTVADVTQDICIQETPVPQFSVPANNGCIPFTLTPANTSTIDDNCNTGNKYIWNVTGPAPVAYANGTNANSKTPNFVFNKVGVYQVKLIISTVSCGNITSPNVQTILVDDKAVASLSPDATFCGTNTTLKFDNTVGSPTQTTLSGAAQPGPATYSWTVTGGAFTFTNGTTAASQYPVINFTDFANYKVSVTNTTNCGLPAAASQNLEFIAAPTVTAGIYPAICSGSPVSLNGTHNGALVSEQWTGGTGTFTNINAEQTTYMPSAQEIAAGKVTLTLQGTTTLAAPCNIVTDVTTILINSADNITSLAAITSCANKPLKYNITSAQATTTYSWVVDASKTTASASGYTTAGTGSQINDILSNGNTDDNATVTYNITTTSNGCQGAVFPLTVTIPPVNSTPSFTKDKSTACGNIDVQFTNTSKPINSVFLWTFGDGGTSSEINPLHTFLAKTDGRDTVYYISLSIQSNCNTSTPYLDSVRISPAKPSARLIPDRIEGCSPFLLAGKNSSPGKNLKYTYYIYNGVAKIQEKTYTDKSDFKFDLPLTTGNTSTIYSLFMVAEDFCGNKDTSAVRPITVSAPVITADMFIQNNVKGGCYPLTVNLVNNSLGGDRYVFYIYNTDHVRIGQAPVLPGPTPFTFPAPGTYYVTVNVASSCSTGPGNESDPMRNVVVVTQPPAAGFTAAPLTGCSSVNVTFTNTTTGDPDTQPIAYTYTWDFGDGSAVGTGYTNVQHTYTSKNSPFTVKLIATNSATGCSDTVIRKDYINISAPPGTQFTAKPDTVTSIPNYQFQFADLTTGSPVRWLWDFGDGSTTNVQPNPSHAYVDTGKYKVTLLTTNKDGCDSTISHYVRITGIPGQLYLPNAFMPTSGTIELQKFTGKGSGIKLWHLQVFNGFGQLMWETSKLSDPKGTPIDGDGWDGTFNGVPVQQGVYIWQASATFINGSEWKGMSYNNSLPKRTGTIHLIR
jgi:PKD repeat protein